MINMSDDAKITNILHVFDVSLPANRQDFSRCAKVRFLGQPEALSEPEKVESAQSL